MGNLIAYEDEEDEEEYEEQQAVSSFVALALLPQLFSFFPPKLSPFQEEIVPFDITALRAELIHNIVRNLNYQDYVNFEECSKFTDRVLNSGKFSLYHRVAHIYINKVC